jgi:photosystem II stability/assembly factor-like uncharacterized protein
MRIFNALCSLLLVALSSPLAQAADPAVTTVEFDGSPEGLFFFEDSEVVLAIDSHKYTVFVTDNSGQTWAPANGIDAGNAIGLYMHPKNNQVAIVEGTEMTHWITEDQGKTWRAFKAPTIASESQAFSFHYNDAKRILFHSFDDCLMGCVGKVSCSAFVLPPLTR